MSARALLLTISLIAPVGSPAHAETRDARWYATHHAERLAMERYCALGNVASYDCAAAQQAGWAILRSQADAAQRRGVFDNDMTHAAYWARNPFARAATIHECANPQIGNYVRPSQAACMAAAEAQLLSGARR